MYTYTLKKPITNAFSYNLNKNTTKVLKTTPGVTYGSIDKNTSIFRGQFVIDDLTYYVEDADKFLSTTPVGNKKVKPVSVLYSSADVVMESVSFESGELPRAPNMTDPEEGGVGGEHRVRGDE